MSLPSTINELLMGSTAASYTISNSLRFRSSASAYLNRTPASAGNRQICTFSSWMKLGTLATGDSQNFFTAGTSFGTNNNDLSRMFFSTANKLCVVGEIGGSTQYNLITTQVFRDPSSWYHVIVSIDTTQATSSNRIKVYVNGAQITAFDTATYPSQNNNTYYNAANLHKISGGTSASYFDGYLAEINFIDGQALTPSSFGETDSTTGVWKAKRYSGSYGTNGFYLKFNNGSSTTTLGYDSSGNGNNWTTNNISLTPGSTYDWMTDSPTPVSSTVGNYAVLNPLDHIANSYVTVSDGNLTCLGNSSTDSGAVASSMYVNSGLWYWELTRVGTGQFAYAGAVVPPITSKTSAEAALGSGLEYRSDGPTAYFGVNGPTLTTWNTDGDIIMVALDATNGAVYFGKNGTWLNSGVPTSGSSKTGATGTWTGGSVTLSPAGGGYQTGNGVRCNFGQRPFTYTPPTGFKTFQTYNLPTPTIKKGNQYFDATLYTGNGSTQSITNSGGFAPDFVWIKERSSSSNHALYDSVRGNTKVLSSDATVAEYTQSPTAGLSSFNSGGFSVTYPNTGDYYINRSTLSYIGWQWKAGGTAVTNTAGSITSQVSANPTAGFSVVTYTCNNTSNQSIGHGLGIAPSMVIVKDRDQGTGFNWNVWFTGFSADEYLLLNTTGAKASYSTLWYTVPDTTKFYIGTRGTGSNKVTDKMVAYCFAAIPGYSAFGSYTGNGSADGPFVYCGFRPRFILLKRSSGVENWQIYDTSRDTYNVAGLQLLPSSSGAEADGRPILDIVSNGFKLRNATGGGNASADYIYAAFAENPFKYSLAR